MSLGHDINHRANNFDFLRFLLATLVILSHSFDMLGGQAANPTHAFTRGQMEIGTLSVYGFFALSGYLVCRSFLTSKSTLEFFIKRALRIYPGFVCAAVLGLLLFGPIGARFSAAYWQSIEPVQFVSRLFTLQPHWVPQAFNENHWPYVNAPVWTVQYEAGCYVLAAVLGLLGVLRSRWLTTLAFAASFVFALLHEYANVSIINWTELPIIGKPDFYARFGTFFLAGALFIHWPNLLRSRWWASALAIAALLVTARLGTGMLGVAYLAIPYLLLTLGHWQKSGFTNWGKHGDFSYGLYLYAWPVQQILIMYGKPWINPWLLFVLAWVITLGLAYVSWHLIEKPCLGLKARLSKRSVKKLDPDVAVTPVG